MMSIRDKIHELKSFVASCELTIPIDAGLKSGLQYKQGNATGISLQYAVYRWVQFALHGLIMLGAILELSTRSVKTYQALYYAKWLLYLTSWVLIGNTVQSLVGAVIVTLAYRHWARGGEPMTLGDNSIYGVSRKLVEAYCTMYCIALNFTVFMVFGYWELMSGIPKAVSPEEKVGFGFYGFSVFLMLADLFAVKFQYKMATGLYSLGIILTYMFITWVHFFTRSLDAYQKKPFLYPGLDWSKPGVAVEHAVSSVFILEVVNCSTLWWFGQLRRRAVNKMNPEDQDAEGHHSTRNDTSSAQPTHPANFHDPHDHHHHHDDHSHPPSTGPHPTDSHPTDRSVPADNEPETEASKKKKK